MGELLLLIAIVWAASLIALAVTVDATSFAQGVAHGRILERADIETQRAGRIELTALPGIPSPPRCSLDGDGLDDWVRGFEADARRKWRTS